MKLFFLGTGEAFDDVLPNTSILVNREFLLDCGYNTPQKFWDLKLNVNKLKNVWISHFHADHTFGLPAILMRFWEEGRNKPLTVIGPKGVHNYLEKVMELAYGDFVSRFEYEIRYEEADAGKELEVNGYNLKFADTGHTENSLAINVSKEGKSFVYTGDSPYSENVVELAKDCNLLIQEAYLPLSIKQKLMKEGKAANHCSWKEAGEAAQKAGAEKLAIVHANRYVSSKIENMIKEASEVYDGKVIVPTPGYSIEI
jgi:ribonuclease BN (tRNA processing enzyme)